MLDALTALDGRVRSAHSTVDRVDAVRVRDLLATHLETAGVLAASVHAPEASEEPESRLMLETQETRNADVERPHYMPLFVAPQPIPEPLADDEDVDDGPDYVADDSDADDEGQLDRPANRRRRRGRRGRGRGRGEQGGSDGDPVDQQSEPRAQQFTSADAAETDDGDDRDSEDTEAGDNGEDENGSLEAGNRRRRRRRRR
ncbi:ribonuclease E/G, partial [Mycobacterium tuberculosis]